MKNLPVSIASITNIINENSVSKDRVFVTWKRNGLEYNGSTNEMEQGVTTLQKNLRRGTLKNVSKDIKKQLNEIGMDCDFVAGFDEPTNKFLVRLTVKQLEKKEEPEVPVIETKKGSKPKTDKTVKVKTVGVLGTILELIKKAPQTQASILDALVFAFPEREAAAMKKTVSAQIGGKSQPTRMEKERSVEFLITVKDKVQTYSIKPETK